MHKIYWIFSVISVILLTTQNTSLHPFLHVIKELRLIDQAVALQIEFWFEVTHYPIAHSSNYEVDKILRAKLSANETHQPASWVWVCGGSHILYLHLYSCRFQYP
jgi:hypothetical protein